VGESRKVLYFLGAGASFGAGATAHVQGGGELPIPTQATFWEIFLRFCRNSERRRRIESFLFRYFMGYGKVPSRSKPSERRRSLNGCDVEEVFTFLSERVRAPSTTAQLRTYAREVWDDLVAEVGNVFRRFEANPRTKHAYRLLYRNHVRSFDTIVSFNYDTVFEDSLPQKVKWGYEGIENCTNRLALLKPHGSINWAFEEGEVRLSPVPDRCVIVAPTHLKFITGPDDPETGERFAGYLDQAPQIQKIWAALEREMKDARALVFLGYSFPMADLYFSSLLRSVLASRESSPAIVLVNPDAVALSERLSKRFSVGRAVRYFDMAQFVQATRRDVFGQI
jgi:hypothetical protein